MKKLEVISTKSTIKKKINKWKICILNLYNTIMIKLGLKRIWGVKGEK